MKLKLRAPLHIVFLLYLAWWDAWTHGRTHQHTDIGMDAHMNGLTLERTNAQKDRRTDRWIHA